MSLPVTQTPPSEEESIEPVPTMDIMALNNNMKTVLIADNVEDEEVYKAECEEVSVVENGETSSEAKGSDELTDDTGSDDQSGEAVYSESSGVMYGSDDIIFDDDTPYESEETRSNSVDYLKEKAIDMLQQELKNARQELRLKDAECKELTDVRTKVEEELEELTASLFEEAHKMVHDANMKQYIAEKRVNEARGEIEALQTEVSALKSLVLTSTPSNPNPQHHPQLIKKKKESLTSPIRRPRKTRGSLDSRKNSHPDQPPKPSKPIIKMGKEVDSVIMQQLSDWTRTISIAPPPSKASQSEKTSVSNIYCSIPNEPEQTNDDVTNGPVASQLLQRIEEEDIRPCLTFTCTELAAKVYENVQQNTLTIEPLLNPTVQKCALSGATICCKHRIKCGDSTDWFPISQACRTRIASVCDFLTYIRYVRQGLVKHAREHMYWEINRLRREMSLAKLGYFKED